MVKHIGIKKNYWMILALVLLGVFLLVGTGWGAGNKININTASVEELDGLPDIGPAKAQAIIDYRTQHGLFVKIEDIMNVPGIGEATFNEIKDLITVDEGGVEKQEAEETGQGEYSKDILINELMPNPSESDDYEWIELYNQGSTTVDLDSWQIADNSKSFTLKATETFKTTIEAQDFLVIPKVVSGISLNNTGGEGVTLKNPNGTIAGQTNYSESAGDNYGWARNESGGYEWTTTATEGVKNIITQPIVATSGGGGGGSTTSGSVSSSSTEKKNSTTSSFKDKILITEILANPLGMDGEANEWLEIYNTSTAAVDLNGWKLKDNLNTYVFTETKIESKSFLVLKRGQTQLILNNEGGERLELSDREGKSVARVDYKVNSPEGQSYNWCGRTWQWLVAVTEGAENKCPPDNEKPTAYFEVENKQPKVGEAILMNAEESYDPDGQIVKYSWQFEQEAIMGQQKGKRLETRAPLIGVKFLEAGIHKVDLTVEDNLGGKDSYKLEVEVRPDGQAKGGAENIFINEIMANPKGVDAGQEWLELYNGGEEINLKGWSLQVAGGKTFKIVDETMVPQGGYLVLTDKITKLVLFNGEGVLKLLATDGQVAREINYGKAPEGQSYARDEEKNNSWGWTSKPTPGAVNAIIDGLGGVKPVIKSEPGTSVAVRIVGVVTAEPGLLGKNIFYIQEESGRGAQIYSYYKDFPNLALGDKVEVAGTESDYQGERRIKTKSRNEIKILANGTPAVPMVVQVEDVGEDNEGGLVKIAGQVTETKGATWWLDDGTGEMKIYFKQNTSVGQVGVATGDRVEVVGIASVVNGEYRILPRFPDDVRLVEKVLGAATETVKADGVEKTGEGYKYLLALAVAVILGLVSYILKNKRGEHIIN